MDYFFWFMQIKMKLLKDSKLEDITYLKDNQKL